MADFGRIGVVASSRKPHERRVPLHPAHLERLAPELRARLVFERGYGARFGIEDEALGAPTMPRDALFAELDALILPKPSPEDLLAMRPGAVLWGWPHAVQQGAMADAAVARGLTLVAFEDMDEPDGTHTFARNNELAGYCAVLHGASARGIDGHHGPARAVVVLGLGAVGRGALRALAGLGFTDVTVCTQEPGPHQLVRRDPAAPARMLAVGPDGTTRPLLALLARADLIVNAVRQDPLSPVYFVTGEELAALRPGCLILDVSCDQGMGFDFAAPTSFDQPLRRVGACDYYAVDHTPSWLWEAASWEISAALLPHLPAFAAGPAGWSRTLRRATAIEAGVIRDRRILAFRAGSTSSSVPSAP